MSVNPSLRRSLPLLLTLALSVSAEAADGQKLIQRLPAQSSIVLGLDLQRSVRSPLFKTWWAATEKDAERLKRYKAFTKKLGFDPVKQLETMVLGVDVERGPKPGFLVVSQGSFSKKKLFATITKEGGKRTKKKRYRGIDYLTDKKGDKTAVAWIDGHVAIGPEDIVRTAIENRKKDLTLGDAGLRRMVTRAAPGAAGWLVARLPERGLGSCPMAAFGAVREVYGRIELEQDLTIKVVAVCPDKGVADGLIQASGMLVISTLSNPKVAQSPVISRLLSGMVTRVEGLEFIAELRLTANDFQELVLMASQIVEGSRGPRAGNQSRKPPRGSASKARAPKPPGKASQRKR